MGDAESDGEPIAVVGNVQEAVVQAAKELLKVDANMYGGGGTKHYKDKLRVVVQLLEQLAASAEKDKAKQLMTAMDMMFNCKTQYTWRPYVLALLRTLGESIEGYLRPGQMTLDLVSHAESGAVAVASGGKPELMPNPVPAKKPRTKAKEVKESEPGEASSIVPMQLKDAPKSSKRARPPDAPPPVEPHRNFESKAAISDAISTAVATNEKDIAEMKERHNDRFSPLGKQAENWIQSMPDDKWNFARGQAIIAQIREATKPDEAKYHAACLLFKERIEAKEKKPLALALPDAQRSRKRTRPTIPQEENKTTEVAASEAKFLAQQREIERLQPQVAAIQAASPLQEAVPQTKRPSAKSGPSRVQRAGRTGASGGDQGTPRLDRFFKPRSMANEEKDVQVSDGGEEQEEEEDDEEEDEGSPSASSSRTPAPNASPQDAKGYYADLQVSTRASYAEIKAAYRRLILQHHPDKGGCCNAFRRVQEAYDLLSDDGKRAAYDSSFVRSAWQTQAETADAAQHEAEVLQSMAAKSAFATMLQRGRDSWLHVLAGMDLEILKLMATMCEASNSVPESKIGKRRRDSAAAHDDDENAQAQKSGKGIFWLGGGWTVQVGWHLWKIRNVKPISDLAQARDLHIAFIDARRAAKERYQQYVSELAAAGLDAGAIRDSNDCEPMTHQEFLTLQQEDPFTAVHFCSDFNKMENTPRVQTIWTPSIQSAKSFRTLTRRTLKDGGNISKLKAHMSATAKIDREAQAQLFRDAANFVCQEAARRSVESIKIEDEKKAAVLCLKETSAEEERASMMAAMRQEIQAQMLAERQDMQAMMEVERQEFQAKMHDLEADAQKQKSDVQKQLEQLEEARQAAEEARKAAEEAQQKAQQEASSGRQMQPVRPAMNPLLENNQNYLRSLRAAETDRDNRTLRYMTETLRSLQRSGSSRQRAVGTVKAMLHPIA